jgi:hypothetical protein
VPDFGIHTKIPKSDSLSLTQAATPQQHFFLEGMNKAPIIHSGLMLL